MTTAELDTATRPCIVAGFDDTPSGFDAVALGRALAETTGAWLLVVDVYPLNAVGTADIVLDPAAGEKLRDDTLRRLERVSFVLDGFEDWDTIAYAAAPPARGLHEVAERADAQVIVVGSTHRHGLGRVMPGSTAEKLLHGAGLPIAVAPAGWRAGVAKAIGAGFDGSPESRAALTAAGLVARAAGAPLRVMSVFDKPNPANPVYAVTSHGYTEIMGELRAERAARLEEALASVPERVACVGEVLDGHPAEVLARESGDLDLLVIGSRGYGALRATTAGTTAHWLSTACRCPLMLVPRGVEHPLAELAPRGKRAAR
jgi:nucleotide-binding universal stress UspA family protein